MHSITRLEFPSKPLAQQIRFGQLDELIPTPVKYSLHHPQREAFRLFDADFWWQGQLLPVDDCVNQDRAVMLQRLLDRSFDIGRIFYSNAFDAHSFRHRRKVGIDELGA